MVKAFLVIKGQKSIVSHKSHVLLRNLLYIDHPGIQYNQSHHFNLLISCCPYQELPLTVETVHRKRVLFSPAS